MMMILKRKEVLIGSLILLILVAAFINFNYSQQPAEDPNAALTSAQASASPSPQPSASPDGQQVDETARKMGEAQYVNSNAAEATDSNYFAEARMNKESARSKSMEMLNEMLNNANVDAESKQKAQEDMLALAAVTDKEASCENLIKAKGFEECVVFVNGDSVSVTVKSEGLSSSDLAKIQEIVSSQTGISIKNIKIVEVK